MEAEDRLQLFTMENRPLATCAGDQALFSSVYSILVQQLPREPMEWRRSYGRPPKMIHLEANFVQFKEELIPKEGNRALLTFPFLHIFWTDCCDTEVYKATAKDEITKWQNILKAYSSVDWLIVVVESDAKKKNKTNILPRTSIVDKIRNDFCNKQSDRCVVLSDPLKDSARTQESWNVFFAKLRTLLLMSFTKNLGKFEDDMRTMREKRTEAGWSFSAYFMVQEELAFVFEMLQQYEDALVQYDELDALFTQYIVNYGAGDGANWLTSFCQPVRSWNGLVLRKPIDMDKRELIQRNQATLLDLRSYLFSRQCTLLVLLQRPWEVAQRALQLLHNCVQELKLLEVSVPVGALDCWVFLSCLEVLQRIEGCCERAVLDSNCGHTVGLWAYATEKLKSLGNQCGLVTEGGPDSEDLNRTVDVLAGLGTERSETANSPQSPYKTLNEALSSVEAFEKHYLELSYMAMEMYKTIGRVRSAQLLGKELADFYMRKGEPEKAESYLQEALRTYLSEGWALLIAHTRKQLAECQKRLQQTQNYLQTSSLLASDQCLAETERIHYCQEILKMATMPHAQQEERVPLGMEGFARLRRLRLEPAGAVVHMGGTLDMELTIHSLMPVAVPLDQLSLHLHLSPAKGAGRGGEGAARAGTATGTVVFAGAGSGRGGGQTGVELYELHDRSPSDNSLTSSSIVCKNMHLLLRRQESCGSIERSTAPLPEDSARSLHVAALVLQPGDNNVTFTAQAKELPPLMAVLSPQTLYGVRADISPPLGVGMCKMGTLCSLEVSIVRLSDLTDSDQDEALSQSDGLCTTRLMYEVVDNSSNWAVCGKSSGVISMPVSASATHKVHMEVMPLFAGFLPFPDITLHKYLPFQACPSGQTEAVADSWLENDVLALDRCGEEQQEGGSVRSRGSTQSGGSGEHKPPALPLPRLLPFCSGQVYNGSARRQVLVLPTQDDHVLEVSVT
ncbi:trafficking protein particle complex subunit 10 [Amblyraja radiata]|uniref:trafficking protein particle complex subunit 10 n=1 Tax=Amblyraja radiata TaxID=386614 RepID=UPI001403836A|nr:trafficking protein particle complex subunit 10 [Amblyraja radiata]